MRQSVEPMRVPAYLSKSRHGIWYFRFVFPARVRDAFPGLPKEIRKSMRTRDPRAAAIHSRKMALDLHTIAQHLDGLLMKPDDKVLPSQLIVEAFPGGGARFTFEPGDSVDKSREFISLLVESGQLTPQQASDPLRTMQYAHPTPAEVAAARLAASAVRSEGPWLSEAVEMFRDEKQNSGGWSREKTWGGTYEPLLRHFREIISQAKRSVKDGDGKDRDIWDIRVRDINDEHIRQYVKAMWTFPVNWGSTEQAKDADAKQALLLGLPPQSRDTAFKKQRMTKTFVIWARQNRFLTEDLADVFPSQVKVNRSGPPGYLPWSEEELKAIFERDLLAPGVKYRDMMYWGPMLGLYSGARANEIAQLTVADVVVRDGIHCLRITDMPGEDDDEGQAELPEEAQERRLREKNRVKNEASRRIVPIHPALLAAGFLDYVDYLRSSNETRLFPEATYEEASGFGRKLSRQWRRTTQELGIWKKRKKVFHSFRSTLNGRLFKRNVPQEVRELILGHENDSTNSESYLKDENDVPVRLLHEYLSRVSFGLQHQRWAPPAALPRNLG